MKFGDKPHHAATIRHGVNFSDGLNIFIMIVMPSVAVLVLYFELRTAAEEWYGNKNIQNFA